MTRSTSIQALNSISNAQAVRDLVCDAIKAAGFQGLTADECADQLNIDRLTVRPRTSELSRDGLIIDSLDRRPNASGKKAIVWVAV